MPIFPVTNATTYTPPKPTGTAVVCEAACSVRYPELYGLSWAREADVTFTEDVTVGTVRVITTIWDNATAIKTYTEYDEDVPRWYTLYQQSTNNAGTKVVEVGITHSDSYTLSTFAYPTPWVDYPSQYHWEGVLPTHDEKYTPICSTATDLDIGEVTSHPLYPQPTDVTADKEDLEGANHVPLWVPLQQLPDKKWFDSAFPSESAFLLCEPVPGKPAPKDISTARFVLATMSSILSTQRPGFIHVESSVTGFETTKAKTRISSSAIIRIESSVTGFQATEAGTPSITQKPSPSNQRPAPTLNPTGSIGLPDIPQLLPTISLGRPQPSRPLVFLPSNIQIGRPVATNNDGETGLGTHSKNMGLDNPGATNLNNRPGQPAPTPPPNSANPTPIFTFVSTTVDGLPTILPVFILPDSSSTATLGQTVIWNGQTSILSAPETVFAIVPTTIDGVLTSTPAFIISGTSTASIGQTVILNGKTTVLTAPAPFITAVSTTIFGIETSVTAYVFDGSITAFPGQTITVEGQTTVLPPADAIFTSLVTTINGQETIIPGYIINGSSTATIGQTVTINGTSTVLSIPTSTNTITSNFDGLAPSRPENQPHATSSSQGDGVRNANGSSKILLILVGLLTSFFQ